MRVCLAFVVYICLSSCGGSTVSSSPLADSNDASTSVEICDGSSRMRLRYESGGGGPGPGGEVVMTEVGNELFLVDGTCTFWTYEASWGQVRTGKLTVEQSHAIAADLKLSSWSSWKGTWHTDVCDGGGLLYAFDDTELSVQGQCGESSDKPPFDLQALGAAMTRSITMVQDASEVGGGVHANLFTWDDRDPVPGPVTSFPDVSFDPAHVALTRDAAYALGRGESIFLPNADDAVKLRAVRDEYLAGKFGYWTKGQLTLQTKDGALYGMFFRDVLPAEDASGLPHYF